MLWPLASSKPAASAFLFALRVRGFWMGDSAADELEVVQIGVDDTEPPDAGETDDDRDRERLAGFVVEDFVLAFFVFVRRTGVTGGSGSLRTLRLRWDRRTGGVSEAVDSSSELYLCCLKVGSGS